MADDINKLNPKQLNDLIAKAEARKLEMRNEALAALRERIQKMLDREGLRLQDVFGGTRRTTTKKTSRAPKYQNPADPAQTWCGMGKRPRWFNAALKAGKKEAQLRI